MPKEKYRRAVDCFRLSDKIRAKHLLYKDFQDERTDINKFVFYLFLQQNELQAKYGKDENGDIGYGLAYVPKDS